MDQDVTDRVEETWTVSKKQLDSRRGVIAAQHFEAAAAGAKVLEDGGNAMDAAVVAALVLSVVEPWLSGIGGGGFLVPPADADATGNHWISMPHGAHHLDLRGPHPDDVTAARQQEEEIIWGWIADYASKAVAAQGAAAAAA